LSYLGGLAPLGPGTDQTADGTGQTDDTIVEVGKANRRDGDSQVEQVRDELYPGSGTLLLNLLGLDDALALLAVNRLLLLMESVESVDTGDGTAQQTSTPGAVGVLLDLLDRLQLAIADSIDNSHSVEGQVASIAELTTDCEITQNRVDGALVVKSDGGSLEVLGEFADTHNLTRCAELLLDRIVGVNSRLRAVGAVQVPGVEAGEVLEGTEKLIATN